jgi:hypothetical protein
MSDLQDFERDLRESLVDAERTIQVPDGLTERLIATTPPPARAPHRAGIRIGRVRWMPPVLTGAAVVAAVAAAVFVTTTITSEHHPAPRSTPPTMTPSRSASPSPTSLPSTASTPSTPPRTPTTAHSAESSASSAPASTSTSRSPSGVSHPTTSVVDVGTAKLSLPLGWVARALPDAGLPSSWCLMPRSQQLPADGDTSQCPIEFRQIADQPGPEDVSVDTTGGTVSNSEWCGQTTDYTEQLLDYGDRTFGGRQADYRRWRYVCPDGTRNLEQYVVDNRPGYVLFSAHADASVHAVIEQMATNSQLPTQTSSLRYSDFGIIRSVQHHADGYHVTLDRVVQGVGTLINENPTTYSYVVPDKIVDTSSGARPITLAVGRILQLTTDGNQVNWVYAYRR